MTPRVRVKICGVTNPDDARLAAAAGADAIGLVFHPPSPRDVSIDAARAIIDALPPFVNAYAVVLNPDPEFLDDLIDRAPVDGLQYHGQEDPELCARFPGRWIKTVPMSEPNALADYPRRYRAARGFLLDGHAAGEAGGQGETFDWTRVRPEDPRPLILAGGLTPDNVGEAIRTVRPWGVDVSSGVETRPGRKDPDKVEAFLREVSHAAS